MKLLSDERVNYMYTKPELLDVAKRKIKLIETWRKEKVQIALSRMNKRELILTIRKLDRYIERVR